VNRLCLPKASANSGTGIANHHKTFGTESMFLSAKNLVVNEPVIWLLSERGKPPTQ
jgi:hypothetical protein